MTERDKILKFILDHPELTNQIEEILTAAIQVQQSCRLEEVMPEASAFALR